MSQLTAALDRDPGAWDLLLLLAELHEVELAVTTDGQLRLRGTRAAVAALVVAMLTPAVGGVA